jgi:predicted CoA-binding protein
LTKKFFASLEKIKNYILPNLLQHMDKDPSSDEQIREILSLKNIAVVGMSKNSSKAAHYVPRYLSENGYDVTPVNPTAEEILGKKCYNSVSEIDEPIDIIDVFRPSDQVLPVIREAIKKKPKVIWLQEGIHNLEAEALAKQSGIKIVFNRCMLAEHRRLMR